MTFLSEWCSHAAYLWLENWVLKHQSCLKQSLKQIHFWVVYVSSLNYFLGSRSHPTALPYYHIIMISWDLCQTMNTSVIIKCLELPFNISISCSLMITDHDLLIIICSSQGRQSNIIKSWSMVRLGYVCLFWFQKLIAFLALMLTLIMGLVPEGSICLLFLW